MNAAILPRTAVPASRRHAIVHVVDSLAFGGLERMVADIALAQRAHGHAVSVFSLTDAGDLGAGIAASGVDVVEGGKRGGFDLAMLRRLRAAIINVGADVVHTHNFVPNYYAALAIAAVPRARPALVNTCHNMGTRLAGPRLRRLYRLSLLRTARVAGVGDGVARNLVERGLAPAARTVAVRNGVRMPPPADATAKRAARDALGIGQDAVLLGCVGRLVGLKNHRLLLGQVAPLARDIPALELVLIGDGPLGDELRAHAQALGIAGRVHFAGTRDDVDRLLPALDAFVLPSRTEGLSIALLEACAAGLPVVASAVGGNPEIIEDGRTGLLFPDDDGDALLATLRTLLADAPLRDRLGRDARAWVERHASLAAVRADYDAVYAQALGRPAACG